MLALTGYDLNDNATVTYRVPPALHAKPSIGASPLPSFGGAGTGGLQAADVRDGFGYKPFILIAPDSKANSPFAKQMEDVRAGFGRTMNRLPNVFGVSRQTLYNWLEGETPREQHQGKLRELAAAARVFTELNFRPTALLLERNVADGKSLLQLLAAGVDGRETARKLVHIAQRGAAAREKLDALLGGSKGLLDHSAVGSAILDEDA